MLLDARKIHEDAPLDADICIIGAGAAGITIAREFINTPYKVVVLESGGQEWDPDTQDLYRGKNIGRHYYDLDVCRLRFLGGTTNHWAGWARPLAPEDFEKRSWVPNSGWPITYDDLVPFYHRAQKVLQLGPFGYDGQHLAKIFPQIGAFPFDPQRLRTVCAQWRPATHFGETYGPQLSKASNVSVFLYANVVAIDRDETGKLIKSVHYATLSGKKREVRARSFVLATGGIENARMLLATNIGNDHDLVGRYFMDHVEPGCGLFVVLDEQDKRWLPYLDHHPDREGKSLPLGYVTLPREVQERERILNTSLIFEYVKPVYSEGFSAMRRILGKEDEQEDQTSTFGQNLRNVIADIDGLARDGIRRARSGRKFAQMIRVGVLGQQTPNPASRVTLGDERDALGMPRSQLDWRLSELDRYSVSRTLRLAAQEFGRLGLGRMKVEFKDWEPNVDYGGYHLMGTTRMSADPRQGVVDANCGVHGISNFYVAGSSVFPTSGNAPPTLTIVTLALRLADHIKIKMR